MISFAFVVNFAYCFVYIYCDLRLHLCDLGEVVVCLILYRYCSALL